MCIIGELKLLAVITWLNSKDGASAERLIEHGVMLKGLNTEQPGNGKGELINRRRVTEMTDQLAAANES